MSKKNQNSLAEFINCLGIAELQTSILYKDLASKTEAPMIRVLLQEIAIDSQKHSTLLKGVSESIGNPKGDPKKCLKHDVVLQKIVQLQREASKIQKISSEDLSNLNERLQLLESQLSEEYYLLVQMKTLTQMAQQILQDYNIDLNDVKRIFTSIISDEEHHTELLETIKKMVTPPLDLMGNTPQVKFQNPDAWYQSPSPT